MGPLPSGHTWTSTGAVWFVSTTPMFSIGLRFSSYSSVDTNRWKGSLRFSDGVPVMPATEAGETQWL
ncbi:hypothetical protein M0R45_020342 [Rubus argutus]|uniref:Uncharacterized protein n=1 Tax=Rubus argutus TaxID=59490 RepID=A0AAW1XAG9_RUBAR